jgi:hypothetical protein
VADNRSAKSERGIARKRLPPAAPSETVQPKSAKLESFSAEQNKEMKFMNDTTVTNAIKLASEGLITPGSSLLLDGNLKLGGAHLVAGLAAKALLGPVGWLLVAASSFSKSVSGKNLQEHFIGTQKEATPET